MFSKNKQLFAQLISIGLPIMAQNLLTFSTSLVDTLMVGGLGEVSLSATALSNRFTFILMIILFGVAGGSNILIAQYWGKRDVASIHKVLAIMYRAVLGLSLFFFLVANLIPEQIIAFYAPGDPAVIAEGAIYLRVVSWAMLLNAFTNSTIMVLRSVRTVHISNLVYGTSLITNTFLNWVFIYGNLGAPALGVAGAALATVIARLVEGLVLLVYLARYEDKLYIRIPKLIPVDKGMVKSFVSNCLPVIANEGLWVAGNTVVGTITGRLGTAVIAALSIEGIVWQLVTVVLFGLQNAASVIVGNAIGAGEMEKLKHDSRILLVLGLVVGALAGLGMYILRPFALLFFTNFAQETLDVAMQLMTLSACILVFQAINFVGMMGILRGGGDQRFVLVFDVIFLWIAAVPLGLTAAFYWHLPIPMVFLCLRSDEIIKSLFAVGRILSNRWAKDLTLDAALPSAIPD